jgi:hypothetical protein
LPERYQLSVEMQGLMPLINALVALIVAAWVPVPTGDK